MAMQKGFTQQVGGFGGMCGKGHGGGDQNPFIQQGGFPNPFQRQGGQNPFIQQGAMQNPLMQQVGMNPFVQQGAMQNPFMQQVGVQNPFVQQGAMQNPFMQQVGMQNPFMQQIGMQNPLAFNPAQMQMLAQLLQNGMQVQQPQNAAIQPDAGTVQAAVQLLQNQGFELKAPVQRKRPQRDADE